MEATGVHEGSAPVRLVSTGTGGILHKTGLVVCGTIRVSVVFISVSQSTSFFIFFRPFIICYKPHNPFNLRLPRDPGIYDAG